MESTACPFVVTEKSLLEAIAIAIDKATPESLPMLAHAFESLSRARVDRLHAERLLLTARLNGGLPCPNLDDSVTAMKPGVRIYSGGKLVAEFGYVPSIGPGDPPDISATREALSDGSS